ncbi:MAG: hypothetical protein J6V72_12130 [Kiritimatiellae bacterium]|nr:hypothetical protein [Kiritimatiellia bacterium]
MATQIQNQAGIKARSYQAKGDGAAASGLNAGLGAFGSALGGLGNAGAGLGLALSNSGAINANAAEATQAARNMSEDIAATRQKASQIAAEVEKLRPYEDIFGNYGSQMWDEGGQVVKSGLGTLAQGDALMSLDPSAGGLVAKYVDYLQKLDPNALVSRAAADTQASYQNALAQQERENARRGVSAGSGNAMALRNQFARALGAALSANKTNAYETGLDRYGAGLGAIASFANDLRKTGAAVYGQGLEGQKAGEGARGDAATVLTQISNLLSESGKMSATAGELAKNQSAALTDAGKGYALASDTFSTAMKDYNNAVGNVVSAGNVAANAAEAAARYYAEVGQGFAEIAGAAGLFSTPGQAMNEQKYREAYEDWFQYSGLASGIGSVGALGKPKKSMYGVV